MKTHRYNGCLLWCCAALAAGWLLYGWSLSNARWQPPPSHFDDRAITLIHDNAARSVSDQTQGRSFKRWSASGRYFYFARNRAANDYTARWIWMNQFQKPALT
jgi:hypothetical protein